MKFFYSPYVLIIDQGSHSSRALVFDGNARLVASASVAIETAFPQEQFVEQSPQAVLQSVEEAINTVFSSLNTKQQAAITSAGLIVQRSSLLACRKDTLQAITPIISWQDTRNRAWFDQNRNLLPVIQNKTGLRPNAHYGASKIRWLLDNDKQVQQAASENNVLFVPLAAYISYHLVKAKNCMLDAVIASRTLLTVLGDVDWCEELLRVFAIDDACLPTIVPSDYHFGDITIANKRIPLHLVGGDQSFIAFATGIPMHKNTAYINVGTGAFVQMLAVENKVVDELLLSALAISADEKTLVFEGTVNAAATALDWLWQYAGKQLSYEAIEQALNDVKTPPLFINTLAGTGSPYWLPVEQPVFVGDGGLEEKTVAVLESVIFALMDNLHCLMQANPHLHNIVIGGGLSQLNGFCQTMANLSGLTVIRPEMHEMSAQGAAVYLLKKQCDENTSKTIFIAQQDELLNARYMQVKALMEARKVH
jgi:glycerol kinase